MAEKEVMAWYAGEAGEQQQEQVRRAQAEHEEQQRVQTQKAAETHAQLMKSLEPLPAYAEREVSVKPYWLVSECLEIMVGASLASRELAPWHQNGSLPASPELKATYIERLKSLVQLNSVRFIDPITMVPWRGNVFVQNIEPLLLTFDDFVLFAGNQGIEIRTVADSAANNEIGAKSWPHVIATMAALAYLAGLKPEKIASSVAAVLEGTTQATSEDTIRGYFTKIRSSDVRPSGKVRKAWFQEGKGWSSEQEL